MIWIWSLMENMKNFISFNELGFVASKGNVDYVSG